MDPSALGGSIPAPQRQCCVCGFTGALLLIKPDEAMRLGLASEPQAAWSCLLHYFDARGMGRKSQNVVERKRVA